MRPPFALVWYLNALQETCLVLLFSTGEVANIYRDSGVKYHSLAGESFSERHRTAFCTYDKYETSLTVPEGQELHSPKDLKSYPCRTMQGETREKIPPASLL